MSSNPVQSPRMLHKSSRCFWVKPAPYDKGTHLGTILYDDFVKT